MTTGNKLKYKNRMIAISATLLEALKQMDRIDQKLLLVFEHDSYKGVLSIGDIQRAILNKLPIDTDIGSVMRKDITLAFDDESFEEIRQRMFIHRTECMPVVNRQGELVEVFFWSEVFDQEKQSLKKQLDLPVVIMAGGEGTRLKPLTNVLPKPLIPYGEKTIIEVIMDRFREFGCSDFHISVNHKSDLIRYYLTKKNITQYKIAFFEETQPLGTAGSLHLLKNKISSPFFVSNCDIIIDIDYADIYDYHKINKNELTIVSAIKNIPIAYGTLETGPNGQLLDIKEKPEITIQINTGMYLLEPHVIDLVPVDKFFHITDLIDFLKKENKKVGVFPVNSGSWKDIGTWEEYLKQIK